MRIASIALKGFRAYRDAEVSFDEPLNVIRGANHSGKTTLKQALELTLTRRSDGTTASGAGSDDKIRQGEKKAETTVTLDTRMGPASVRMSQKAGARNYEIGGSAESIAGFEGYLTANRARWSCCLDAEYFISQPEAEQKAILSALIAPDTYEFDPAMMALAEKQLLPHEAESPIDLIDELYSKAFTARREAKVKLDAIRIPTLPAAPEYTVEKIKEYIGKLQDELGAETGPAPQATVDNAAAIARNQEQTRQKQRELRTAQEDLESAKERIVDCDTQMLSGPQMTKAKKTAEGRTKFDELENNLRGVRSKIKDLHDSIDTVVELAGEQGECPTCKRLLDEEAVDTVVAALKSQIAGLTASETEQMQLQKDLGDIAGAEQKIAEHERAKAQKLEWVKRQTAAGEKITQIGKDIVALNNELATLESQPVAEATPARDVSGIKAKLEAWEKKLLEANTYETVGAQIIQAEARRKEQIQVVDELERLCSYFGKDGVKAKIIKESIEGFTQTVNAALDYWGYSCEISVEPFRFIVTTVSGKTLPLKELSGSERLMFGAALQSAIAIQSGIRLVVIDKADTFIDEDRGALFTALADLIDAGQLDQAIVLVSDNRTEVPQQPGVAFYRVGDGKVERLGQREEQAA